MATVSDLFDIALRYDIPNVDIISIDALKHMSLHDCLCFGQDSHCRFFINLPVTTVYSEALSLVPRHDTCSIIETFLIDSHFVIFLGNTHRDDVFCLSHVFPNQICEILGPEFNDFTILEKLLCGETFRFLMKSADNGIWVLPEDTINHPDYYIDISLRR